MSLAKVNAMTKPEFLAEFGSIYEHSPWVAEEAFAKLPLNSRDELTAIMKGIVEKASGDAKLTLVKAHPDLGGKLARAGKLTAESTKEQAGLGLDRLREKEYQQFATLNERYLRTFGFPFIICAKLNTREEVLAAFERRLNNTREDELAEAMRQIHLIARLRIEEKAED